MWVFSLSKKIKLKKDKVSQENVICFCFVLFLCFKFKFDNLFICLVYLYYPVWGLLNLNLWIITFCQLLKIISHYLLQCACVPFSHSFFPWFQLYICYMFWLFPHESCIVHFFSMFCLHVLQIHYILLNCFTDHSSIYFLSSNILILYL